MNVRKTYAGEKSIMALAFVPLLFLASFLFVSEPALTQQKGPRRERLFPVPSEAWQVATIILGSPSADRICVNIFPHSNMEGFVEFGTGANPFERRTIQQQLKGSVPTQVLLDSLTINTEYVYRLRSRNPGEMEFHAGPEHRFHTQRTAGEAFLFEIQGDSHPERTPKQNDPVLYAQTLCAVADDRPDFFMTIGDDFSVDNLPLVNAESVERVYRKQLPYLGLVAHSSPLFLVNGNHEQAALFNLDGTPDNVAVWAQRARNAFYPQPAPGGIYAGDSVPIEHIGLLRDYYAWTWGDALFVVIDPYWHSTRPVDNPYGGGKKWRDQWDITFGDAQYSWFKHTLEQSKSKFKFVFAHHVNGTGRGGIERAAYYEWGGRGADGRWEFDKKRPGWELPIHQLMAKNGVTIFFQGHDHIFCRQELDGVVYQTLPEPADATYALYNQEAYRSGDVFPGAGRVRVHVDPDTVQVEYVRSYLARDATEEHQDGEIAFAYRIPAREPSEPAAPTGRMP
jgi:hypothetical protein